MKTTKKTVKMSKSSFIKEHKELVKVLKTKNPKALKKELREQSKELIKIKKK